MRCGVGDYSYGLAKALAADRSIRVGVLTSVHDRISNTEGDIEIFPVIKEWSVPEALKVIRIIRDWSPEIVHIQYPTQGYGSGFLPWLLPIVAFAMGRKIVQTWHESYGRRAAPKLFLKAIVPSGLVVVRPNYKDCLPLSLRWALWNKRYVFIRNAASFSKIDMDDREKNALKLKYLKGQNRLIVFFGFVYPNKGTELLFEIGDPSQDQIVIAGQIVEDSDHHKKILSLASKKPWMGKVTITGFLQSADVSALLTIADAVILPYTVGGGEWNTSIHAAVLHGSFVITTSLHLKGYDEKHNIFYTAIKDVQGMREAFIKYAGRRRKYDADIDKNEWKEISNEHRLLYKTL